MIHVEGMGWMGAALAWLLAADGIEFTWHDRETPYVAWKACTGIVYPAGDPRSQANLRRWDTMRYLMPDGTVTEAAYTYAHKNPPHEGRYTPRADLGWARIADAPCFAVDAPAIVHAAREQFAARRTTGPAPGQRVIVAHGNSDRRGSWVWGWSAPVRLHLPAELAEAAAGAPVALYGRAHRFAITYAYPIPTRPGWWWAGSSLINQRNPRELDAAAKLRDWLGHARQLYPPVQVEKIEPPVQGWRPRARAGDSETLAVDDAGRLVFPPLWHSGIRWAPNLLVTAAAWAADPAADLAGWKTT